MNTLRKIHDIANSFSGDIGVIAKPVNQTALISLNDTEVFPTASCIKIPILVELCSQALEKKISLQKKIILQPEDLVPGTGVLKDLEPGLEISLGDLATLAITVSDNSAANILIDKLGAKTINARIQSLGMENTYLGTKFVFNDPEKNVGSPADFSRLLSSLWDKSILNEKLCKWILRAMEKQQYVDYIPRYLPYNRFAEEFDIPQKMKVANKVGMLAGVVNDMAIIQLPHISYILVLFTKNCIDRSYGPDNEGAVAVAKISRIIYNHFI